MEKVSALKTQEATIEALNRQLVEKVSALKEQETTIHNIHRSLVENEKGFIEQAENITKLRKIQIDNENKLCGREAQISILEVKMEEFAGKLNNSEAEKKSLEAQSAEKEKKLKDIYNKLATANSNLIQQKALVDYLESENRELGAELQTAKLSKAYRLSQCLTTEQLSLRKLIKVGYLLGVIIMPDFIKPLLHPLIRYYRTRKNSKTIPSLIDGDKVKVLHVVANFMLGGSSRLIADIVGDLDHFHHEVVTSAAPDEPVYPDIPVHVYPMGFNPSGVENLLELYDADIVHIHYWGDCDEPWYNAVYQLVKGRGCRVIENINTPVAPYIDEDIARYIYVSDYVKNTFGAKDGKSQTIYPGSDFELFSNDTIEDVSDDCIGMVYRLENDKLNLDSIKPFIEVVKRRPETKVIIVGGGSNQQAYESICKDEGVFDSFNFTGYVEYETLPYWYGKMSIFVAPVWKESFGQVSPFAMSMGIPVVGYDIGALSEINGRPDLLAEYGDSDALAEIVIDLLNDREQRLEIGNYNQKRAKDNFSLGAMTSGYKEIYDDLSGVNR